MDHQDKQDQIWLSRALRLAKVAARNNDVPVGAIIVDPRGKLLSVGINNREKQQVPTGHAELIAIDRACRKIKNWRLLDCTLYVTLEPCVMCAGALVHARLSRVVFGVLDPKFGGVQSLYTITQDNRANHRLKEVRYLEQASARALLTQFFKYRRDKKKHSNIPAN